MHELDEKVVRLRSRSCYDTKHTVLAGKKVRSGDTEEVENTGKIYEQLDKTKRIVEGNQKDKAYSLENIEASYNK